ASQRTGWPVRRERARADSSSAPRRCASRSSCGPPASRSANATPAEAIATMAITTSSSMRVKPRARPRGSGARVAPALLPGADVGILAFATRLAVGAERHDVDLALHTRIQVLVGTAPGIVRKLLEVRLPVLRDWPRRRLGDQRLQALLAGGIALVVQLVQLERLHDVVHVRARRSDPRVLRAVQDVGHDEGCEHADDDEDHHQLDQGEAARVAPAWEGLRQHCFHHNRRMFLQTRAAWTVRGATFVLWALAAGSAAFWGLKLGGSQSSIPLPPPPSRSVAAVDPAALARLLGSSP